MGPPHRTGTVSQRLVRDVQERILWPGLEPAIRKARQHSMVWNRYICIYIYILPYGLIIHLPHCTLMQRTLPHMDGLGSDSCGVFLTLAPCDLIDCALLPGKQVALLHLISCVQCVSPPSAGSKKPGIVSPPKFPHAET